ncbi:hypothetical protein F2P81_019798 [Scophthalmus maximus]|uniref:SPARC/Testican calcium-binding domain-containing protein n=1 Tax=Scophthalmus maximus TaxID=52904 RepID=A0A6A4S233_SCOMX|nr:hypothetical protein F2P81_019798 [Scophthalmus maximus]
MRHIANVILSTKSLCAINTDANNSMLSLTEREMTALILYLLHRIHCKHQINVCPPEASLCTMTPSLTFGLFLLLSLHACTAKRFVQLDKNKDGMLSHRDLRKLRYKRMPLEHCAKPFFQSVPPC